MKILVVEDDFLLVAHVQKIIGGAGGDATRAVASVSRAVAVLENEEFDGVLLDGQLADGMSTEVARQLATRHIPFVVVTGQSREWLSSELQSAPYLAKPFDPDELVELAARHFTHD